MTKDQLLKIYKLYLSRLLNQVFIKPDYVGILLTKRCNLKCKMCDIRKKPKEIRNELDFKNIKKIVDDVADWGVSTVTLSGGEPFLRKDFFKIAHYVTNKIPHTAINTNLTLINEKVAEKLCELPFHKFHLEVSLDGIDAETHDNIRGVKGAFSRLIEGVKTIRRVCDKNKTDIYIGVTFVWMEDNFEQVVDLVKMAEEMNFYNVSIMPVLVTNTNAKKRSSKPVVSQKYLDLTDEIIEELIEFKKRNGLLINSEESLKLYKKYFYNERIKRKMCHVGFIGPNVTDDGEVFICEHLIGNVADEGIKDIWHSKQCGEARKKTSKCEKPCLQHYSIPWHETHPLFSTYYFLKNKALDKINNIYKS